MKFKSDVMCCHKECVSNNQSLPQYQLARPTRPRWGDWWVMALTTNSPYRHWH